MMEVELNRQLNSEDSGMIDSIVSQQFAIAKLLSSESQKVSKAVTMDVTAQQLLELNTSVKDTLNQAIKLERLLVGQLNTFVNSDRQGVSIALSRQRQRVDAGEIEKSSALNIDKNDTIKSCNTSTVQGTICSAKSNLPLANVCVQARANKQRYATVSDKNGQYRLDFNYLGNYTIVFTYANVSCKVTNVNKGSPSTINVKLNCSV